MKSYTPILENDFVKLAPLSLGSYHFLLPIANEEKLVQYSPSDIGTAEALKRYVEQVLEKESIFLGGGHIA